MPKLSANTEKGLKVLILDQPHNEGAGDFNKAPGILTCPVITHLPHINALTAPLSSKKDDGSTPSKHYHYLAANVLAAG